MTNEITPFVRACVHLWLAETTLKEFTVSHIISDLAHKHPGLDELPSLCKSASNELVRLETAHKLLSSSGVKGVHGKGVGRTPRVYRKNMIFRKIMLARDLEVWDYNPVETNNVF